MLRKAVIIKMDTTRILELAKENNGIVTTSMVIEAGISRGILKYLVDIGKLERSARGVYILPGTWDDEFVNMQTRFKKGIYSH
ncbi:MAG: type IV toxin-antitoxin system AbiEi family antitoxin domain-containing protein [Erysipelotrichaceae bacterium]|nr:type IV toxin-antitoxin system AbiEi family antitoxin domain-containing protein [Erysipelotrichaceae bacterium]